MYKLLLSRKDRAKALSVNVTPFRRPYELRFKQLFEKRLLTAGMRPFTVFRRDRIAVGHTEVDIAYEYSCYRHNFLDHYCHKLRLLTFDQFSDRVKVDKATRANPHMMTHKYRKYRANWEELRTSGEAVDNDFLCGLENKKNKPSCPPPEDSPDLPKRPRDLCIERAVKSSEPKKKKRCVRFLDESDEEEEKPNKKEKPKKKRRITPFKLEPKDRLSDSFTYSHQ